MPVVIGHFCTDLKEFPVSDEVDLSLLIPEEQGLLTGTEDVDKNVVFQVLADLRPVLN
ncbi:MAG: hypothetical protein V3S41_01120 [Spirochaetia bacterium]